MVNDLIKLFKTSENMEKVVLDNYIPKNGTYFKIAKAGNIDYLVIKRNATEKNELYKWFKEADYYSSLIDMNKAVDFSKKIHSNNYLSFFMKCDILPEVGANKDRDKILTYEDLYNVIDKYYNVFIEGKNDKKTEEILKKLNLSEVDQLVIESYKEKLKSKIPEVIEMIKTKELANKDYVKVFFEEDIETYKEECNRYTLPRIFNKNDFNIEINNEIFGLSNDNMGLNSKKPYLELKTTRFKVPYRISLEDALVSKRLFEWLNCLEDDEGRNLSALYIPINFDFKNSEIGRKNLENGTCLYVYKTMQNGKSQIEDFDIVNSKNKIPIMYIKNYLDIDNYEEDNISELTVLEQKIDQYFYDGRLIWNYYNNDISAKIGVFSDMQVDILLTTKGAMLNYFRKGNDVSFKTCIDKATKEMIKQKFIDKEYINIKDISYAMNFRLNLLKYYKMEGKENMVDRIQEIHNTLKEKINSDELAICKSEEEFYFAAGQVVAFLTSKSEAKNKYHDLTVPFLQMNTARKLKDTIATLFERYGHAVSMTDKRPNNLIGMVMGCETNSKAKDYQDLFISGICSKNILYTKKEEVKYGNNEE